MENNEIIDYIKTTHVIDFVDKVHSNGTTFPLTVNGEKSHWLPLGVSEGNVMMQKQSPPCDLVNIPIIEFYDTIICITLRRDSHKQ